MNHSKQHTLALLSLSVLALAGCSQSQDPAGPAGGPNDADRAAIASVKQNGGQSPAAQADAAKAKAAGAAAAASKTGH